MKVKFEGKTYSFPDDATDDEIRAFFGETVAADNKGDDARLANRAAVMGGARPQRTGPATPDDIPGQKYTAPAKEHDSGVVPLAGIGGNVVGGALGALGGPVVGVAGATAGGALARYGAALYEVNKQGLTGAEAQAFLSKEAGIDSIITDAAGNLAFMVGGKVLFTLAKNTAIGRATIKALGDSINDARVKVAAATGGKTPAPFDLKVGAPGLNAPEESVAPAPAAFGRRADLAAQTSPDDLQAATLAGARELSDAGAAPTNSQLTGHAGAMEKLWKAGDPQGAARHADAQDAIIQKQLDDFIEQKAGLQSGKTPGHTYERAVAGLEESVKAFNDPAYAALDAAGGRVNMAALKAEAAAALNEPGATLAPGVESFLKTIKELPDELTFAQTQKLRSEVLRMAREAEKPGSALSPAAGVYKDWASKTTERLYTALDEGATRVESQASALGSQVNPAQAERAAARAAGAEARAVPPAGEAVPPQQLGMFPEPVQEGMFAEGADAVAGQAAARANAARQGAIDTADAAAAGAEGRIAAGMGEQKSMFKEAPTIDPRLPADVRAAAQRIREMHDTVYGMTGTKALRTAESRGPEHLAKTIYAEGNLTAIEELGTLAKMAAKMDAYGATDAGRKALLERVEKLRKVGGDVDLPGLNGTNVADAIKEAHEGIVAEYLQSAMAGPNALRGLAEAAKNPAKMRTLTAMLPDKADRLVIERLVQMADMAGRLREGTGANLGMQQMTRAGAALLLGAGGAVSGYVPLMIGGAAMYFGPKALAIILTRPAYRAMATKASEEWVRSAGSAAATGSFAATKALAAALKQEGVDVTKKPEDAGVE
jgi:hypothetical protein